MDVRQAVVTRLGYDPFSSYAAATMFTEVTADGASFTANLKLVDGDNAVRGDRTLKTQGACAELMEAMALTISIAIDPESATREGPPPDAPPAERPVGPLPSISEASSATNGVDRASEEPAPAPKAAESATPLALAASLGPLVSVGSAPGIAVGGVLAVDAHYGHFFAGIEGRADAPASKSVTSGQISSSLVMGTLFAGVRYGVVFAGAVAGLGSVRASSSDLARPHDADALIANAGVRAGVAVPLTKWLELRGRLEGLANLPRHRLEIDGREAYRYPVVAGNMSAALAVRFW